MSLDVKVVSRKPLVSGFLGKKLKVAFARFLTQEAAREKAPGLFSQCCRSDLD